MRRNCKRVFLYARSFAILVLQLHNPPFPTKIDFNQENRPFHPLPNEFCSQLAYVRQQ